MLDSFLVPAGIAQPDDNQYALDSTEFPQKSKIFTGVELLPTVNETESGLLLLRAPTTEEQRTASAWRPTHYLALLDLSSDITAPVKYGVPVGMTDVTDIARLSDGSVAACFLRGGSYSMHRAEAGKEFKPWSPPQEPRAGRPTYLPDGSVANTFLVNSDRTLYRAEPGGAFEAWGPPRADHPTAVALPDGTLAVRLLWDGTFQRMDARGELSNFGPGERNHCSALLRLQDGSIAGIFATENGPALFRSHDGSEFTPWQPEGVEECREFSQLPDGSVVAAFWDGSLYTQFRATAEEPSFTAWLPDNRCETQHATLLSDGSIVATFSVLDLETRDGTHVNQVCRAARDGSFLPWGPPTASRCTDLMELPGDAIAAAFLVGEDKWARINEPTPEEAGTTDLFLAERGASFTPWKPEGATRYGQSLQLPEGVVVATFQVDGNWNLYRADISGLPEQAARPVWTLLSENNGTEKITVHDNIVYWHERPEGEASKVGFLMDGQRYQVNVENHHVLWAKVSPDRQVTQALLLGPEGVIETLYFDND